MLGLSLHWHERESISYQDGFQWLQDSEWCIFKWWPSLDKGTITEFNWSINFMALSRKQKLGSFPSGLCKCNKQLIQTYKTTFHWNRSKNTPDDNLQYYWSYSSQIDFMKKICLPSVQIILKHNLLIWILFYENEVGPSILKWYQHSNALLLQLQRFFLCSYINIICQNQFIQVWIFIFPFCKGYSKAKLPIWSLSLKCLKHRKNNPGTTLELFY